MNFNMKFYIDDDKVQSEVDLCNDITNENLEENIYKLEIVKNVTRQIQYLIKEEQCEKEK